MKESTTHRWAFKRYFRRHAFGWKSQPAIQRIREAVSEIRKVARKDPMLGAEGAIAFLEKVSPAIEHVDGSSGAIGAAVSHAVDALAKIIAAAPADPTTRERWLDRLWAAFEADEVPYIESVGDHWGEVCASSAVASRWADVLIDGCRLAWSPNPKLRGFYKGATACLSALLAAGRYDELLALLALDSIRFWPYRRYGVEALAAMGRKAEAIRYAEESRGRNDNPVVIARACEEILLSSGLADEAYRRYGLVARAATTYLAWFRAVAKKYPHKPAAEILADLVEQTPGEEGKWFAAAKDAGLYDEAISLANRTPCAPQTLTRAARDYAVERPLFAIEAGMAALRWLVEGYGYEITSLDVSDAYTWTMKAAEETGRVAETQERIRAMVARESGRERFVTQVIGRRLGLGF
jgi:hypothetical protein